MIGIKTKARLPEEGGAAAVEFALVAGVLSMLIFGMLQFGLAFFELQNLRAAAREGARIGAVGAELPDIRQRVSDASLGSLPATPVIEVIECGDDPGPDASAEVSVNLQNPALPARLQNIFTVNVPFMPPIPINATVQGQFRCE